MTKKLCATATAALWRPTEPVSGTLSTEQAADARSAARGARCLPRPQHVPHALDCVCFARSVAQMDLAPVCQFRHRPKRRHERGETCRLAAGQEDAHQRRHLGRGHPPEPGR